MISIVNVYASTIYIHTHTEQKEQNHRITWHDPYFLFSGKVKNMNMKNLNYILGLILQKRTIKTFS